MANKNTQSRRRMAHLSKQDTTFTIPTPGGTYTQVVTVKASKRLSRRPKVAGGGRSLSVE